MNDYVIILLSVLILLLIVFLIYYVFIESSLEKLPENKIRTSISLYEKTIVKFGENLEFCIEKFDRGMYNAYFYFQITDVKGDFKITKITENSSKYRNIKWPVTHFKHNSTFRLPSISTLDLNFYYSINIPNTKNKSDNSFINSSNKSQKETGSIAAVNESGQKKKQKEFVENVSLSLDEKITVNFEENIKFSIEKVNNRKTDYSDYFFQITDVKGDFKITKIAEDFGGFEKLLMYSKTNKTFHLSWMSTFDVTFYITAVSKSAEKKSKKDDANIMNDLQNQSIQSAATIESRPISAIPFQSNECSTLYQIGTNDRFADVFFITSDKTKIPSHRNILYQFSFIFAKIFDETFETPVFINVEEFNADTVEAGLKFLYGKNGAINGKEMEVFKFAAKYGIQKLINECCYRFEKFVDSSNVCEYIQIAYTNNIEGLKQKCLKILVENRKEIAASGFSKLPNQILIEALSH